MKGKYQLIVGDMGVETIEGKPKIADPQNRTTTFTGTIGQGERSTTRLAELLPLSQRAWKAERHRWLASQSAKILHMVSMPA